MGERLDGEKGENGSWEEGGRKVRGGGKRERERGGESERETENQREREKCLAMPDSS